MKTRTFKPASEIRKVFLRYGTSCRTGNTAGKLRDYKLLGRFGVIVDEVKAMTPDEFLKSLVAAGIISTDGKLEPKYKSVK